MFPKKDPEMKCAILEGGRKLRSSKFPPNKPKQDKMNTADIKELLLAVHPDVHTYEHLAWASSQDHLSLHLQMCSPSL